ncbi:hypothetical protein G2W53_034797 [Senna tora]|uniref:Uncharacterized protein n=1 Tax=Senna tora TaxID=362788 RepID=A0A834T1Z2_9FABA|nr:hypothetical protein G2W53_034797 [Senna tora]
MQELRFGMELERFIQADDANDDDDERCKRHRKEPSCVVGEHKQCPFPPPSLFGEVETVSLVRSV